MRASGLGLLDRTDLIIDLRPGEVQSIVIPYGSRWFRAQAHCHPPWRGIQKDRPGFDHCVDLTTAEDYSAVMKKIQEGRSWNKPPLSLGKARAKTWKGGNIIVKLSLAFFSDISTGRKGG